METIVVAAWLVVAALLLGPPLLGVNCSTWPLRERDTPESGDPGDPGGREERSSPGPDPGRAPTPAGRCRACGEDDQVGYTYCRDCLTPLPQSGEGAGGRDGHPAD